MDKFSGEQCDLIATFSSFFFFGKVVRSSFFSRVSIYLTCGLVKNFFFLEIRNLANST